ncbi:DEAD/DEAH box helicase [Desulfofarcimen acetoxidans]|uniref:DEAD/DEAH box helicase n=1 Tax=Desulfofarcimen acetoxidans TaxID=58138 RepID=UPI0002D8A9D2|nr:DEAD/DEAH box helicase [Desulfofarcimen acetoxidans]
MTGLQKININVPTDIQTKVIPLALQGKDIIGQSETGTGKTLAYLLPLLQKLDNTKRETQAVILAPTQELSIQIQRLIEAMISGSDIPVTSAPIIGNVNIARQVEKLKEKPHIIVGSCSRILDLVEKKKIAAQKIKTIVIDEADRLLDDKNLAQIKALIKTTLKDRQILLFSATIPGKTLERAKEMLQNPQIITIQANLEITPNISHIYFLTEYRDKIKVLRKLVGIINVERALVFVNRGDNIELTSEKLNYHGLKTAGLHAGLLKEERKKAIEDFRQNKIQLLVATDIAARGLDIAGLSYVFNLDMPEDPQAYLHRVGRTGRAGKTGTAISIVARQEAALINKYEKVLKIKFAAKHMYKGKILDTRRSP